MSLISNAHTIYFDTGNNVNWENLRMTIGETDSDELLLSLNSTIDNWLQKSDKNQVGKDEVIDCYNYKFKEALKGEERREYKITVKLFLKYPHADHVKEAIDKILKELDIKSIEIFIVSISDKLLEKSGNSIELLKPMWKQLEALTKEGILFSLGIADLTVLQLKELYNWSEVKPQIHQLSMISCCTIPQEMTDLANERNIQLLTHSDNPIILSEKKFQTLIEEKHLVGNPAESTVWQPEWVTRTSVLVKCRGIIYYKGYLVKATKAAAATI